MKKMVILLGLIVLTAGCVSASKYHMKVDEATRIQSQAQQLTIDKAALEKHVADLQDNNRKLSDALSATKSKKDQMISELTQENQDLTDKAAALEKEKEASISSMKKTYDNLVKDMETEIKQGEVQITQLQGKLTVNMVDKVLFNSGEAEVNGKGKDTLDKVGAILKNVNDKQIRIEGHTDNIPISKELQQKYASNWELSTARATHVARYLIEKVGIDAKLLSVSGYADTRPVDINTTPEGRAKNRRIEIVLVPLENAPVADTQQK